MMLAAFRGVLAFIVSTRNWADFVYIVRSQIYIYMYIVQLQQLLFELANANNCICDFAALYKDNV